MRGSADVVVPVFADLALTERCLRSVLEFSGRSLQSLIIVDDCGPDPQMRVMLRALRLEDERVRLLENEENRGFVSSANRGLSIRRGDVVVLNSDTEVTAGWLDELLLVLRDGERVAAATPLSNNATLSSVPDFGLGARVDEFRAQQLDLSKLPRTTEVPTAVGFCMAMRGEVLDLVGLFDPAFGRGYNEENDWCQRARSLGFTVVRANRAFVFHHGEVSFQGARNELDAVNGRRLVKRYPAYLAETRDFESSAHARVAAIGVAASLRPLRVCLDLSHVVAPSIHGTAIYGTQLAKALSRLEQIDLTVRVGGEALAHELNELRCISRQASLRGFDIVHKPSQVYDESSLRELLSAEGHLILTWQDLIAHRSPVALGDIGKTFDLRKVTWAALSAAQGVVALSTVAEKELLDLMPSLSGRTEVVPLGCDVNKPSPTLVAQVRQKLGLARPYVCCLGSDYPHKNIGLLLEAWRLLELEQFDLVLAGPPSRLPRAPFSQTRIWPARTRWLGELNRSDVMPVLAGSELCVMPSVYEGFGLGALEAMACEVPILVSGLSALKEVAGEAAFEPQSLSPEGLAASIRQLLLDPSERRSRLTAGVERCKQFSWQRTAARTRELYDAVARSPNKASLQARNALRSLLRDETFSR